MTGINENISLGFDLSMIACVGSHRAPCMFRPLMYAPSRAADSTFSTKA
jgi:hypothetical protein